MVCLPVILDNGISWDQNPAWLLFPCEREATKVLILAACIGGSQLTHCNHCAAQSQYHPISWIMNHPTSWTIGWIDDSPGHRRAFPKYTHGSSNWNIFEPGQWGFQLARESHHIPSPWVHPASRYFRHTSGTCAAGAPGREPCVPGVGNWTSDETWRH